ncbi:hypothetical protein SUGI_1184360 [Cryptomeria japonica]|nr:hypothetical protein SUGI_1184360 [Cryptomeria japonica]
MACSLRPIIIERETLPFPVQTTLGNASGFSAMGYPVGCRFMVIPKVLLYSASAMASLNNGICCFLSDLGLCEPPQEEEIYLGQGLPEISSLISSASEVLCFH